MLSVPNPIMSTALRVPEHVVLRCGSHSMTALQLSIAVRRRAQELLKANIGVASRVALCAPLDISWVINFHALGYIGATVVPVDPALPADRIQERLRVAEAEPMNVGPAMTQACIGLDVPKHSPNNAIESSTAPVDALLEERPWPLNEARLILFSSGSTGRAKPVVLTTAQLLFAQMGTAISLGHHLNDAWLMCVAPHHIAGVSILWRCSVLGTCAVLEPRFRAKKVVEWLRQTRLPITQISLVPAMLADVLDVLDTTGVQAEELSHVRMVLLGGAPVPTELRTRARDYALPVIESYGMTETAAFVAGTPVPHCGVLSYRPHPFVRVTESTENTDKGKDAQSIEKKSLCIRGPVVASGYLRTDDRGTVRADGIRVLGRTDRVINSGGIKIDPDAVASTLRKHSDVNDAYVCGVPHPRFGEMVVALLEFGRAPENHQSQRSTARDERRNVDDISGLNTLPSTAALRSHCRHYIEAHAAPRLFVWCLQIPRTALHKVDVEGLDVLWRDIEARLAERHEKTLGNGNRTEIPRDTHMNQFNARAGSTSAKTPDILEVQAGASALDETHLPMQFVAHASGALVVRFCMHEGEQEFVKGFVPLHEGVVHKLFEDHMAVVEKSSEIHNSRVVNIGKTHAQTMTKNHGALIAQEATEQTSGEGLIPNTTNEEQFL